MTIVFWISAAYILYVYLGYPALLWIWARVRQRSLRGTLPSTKPRTGLEPRPGVSIVIAARNEGHRLRARIENLLQLDYPARLRQIIVVSDGSTDDTAAVVAAFRRHVNFVSVPAGGKARALNAGVERARFDLLVFTDVRQLFARDALIELTRPLQDPGVGAVTGELLLDCESSWRRTAAADRRSRPRPQGSERRRGVTSTIAAGVSAYWRYEKTLRRLESAVGSTLGATGAIYAMRRALWRPLPPDTILDDVLAPMRTVLAGSRVIFNPRAQAFDLTAADATIERRRKVRTLAGNYQILWLEPRVLVPWRNPVWVQYLSHKIGRLLVPYALLAFFVASVSRAGSDPFALAALVWQCGFYLLAAYGAWLDAGRSPSLAAAVPAQPPPLPISRGKEVVNA